MGGGYYKKNYAKLKASNKKGARCLADYEKLKAEYIAGGISYRQLAKKYNIPFSNLKNYAIKEHWVEQREQVKNKTTTKLIENVSEENAKVDDLYFSILDKLMKKVEECIENTDCTSPNAIKTLSSAMRDLQACKGVKSEADAREQEARIMKLRKEAQEEDNSSKVIKVEIAGELGEYCK